MHLRGPREVMGFRQPSEVMSQTNHGLRTDRDRSEQLPEQDLQKGRVHRMPLQLQEAHGHTEEMEEVMGM